MAEAETEESGVDKIGLYVALVSLVVLGVTGVASWQVGGIALQVAFLLSQVVVISVVIWQARDPFAEAAQWIGVKYHLPGSVRGATLDAVASSMPELFSGIFFVLVAVFAAGDSAEAIKNASSNGYGATVAICAGSAIYNMILIPAICALVISYTRKSRPTIDISPTVILRDGMWFLGCELLLIMFLFQSQLHWWMGVVFLLLYVVYVRTLYADASRFRRAIYVVRAHVGDRMSDLKIIQVEEALQKRSIRSSRSLVTEVQTRLLARSTSDDDDDDKAEDAADVLFGIFEVPLHTLTAWLVILVATVIAAASCYWLVEVTREAAAVLNVPIFFIAVIVAAAASSVPDTFLSVGAARRGDDDGAVSNVFGSNIFDICVCLSIPLLVGCYLNGWEPLSLTQNGQPMPGLIGIRVLLCSLTVVTLLIMWHNQQITRRKAYVLCALYGIFVLYAVAGSLGYSLDKLFS